MGNHVQASPDFREISQYINQQIGGERGLVVRALHL